MLNRLSAKRWKSLQLKFLSFASATKLFSIQSKRKLRHLMSKPLTKLKLWRALPPKTRRSRRSSSRMISMLIKLSVTSKSKPLLLNGTSNSKQLPLPVWVKKSRRSTMKKLDAACPVLSSPGPSTLSVLRTTMGTKFTVMLSIASRLMMWSKLPARRVSIAVSLITTSRAGLQTTSSVRSWRNSSTLRLNSWTKLLAQFSSRLLCPSCTWRWFVFTSTVFWDLESPLAFTWELFSLRRVVSEMC